LKRRASTCIADFGGGQIPACHPRFGGETGKFRVLRHLAFDFLPAFRPAPGAIHPANPHSVPNPFFSGSFVLKIMNTLADGLAGCQV
jgi:hypothetical protein